jgi:hypothetical protein
VGLLARFYRYFKWIALLLALIVIVVLYKNNNPSGSAFFPKCPFKTITGYKCPGCGAQRAVHCLLNLDIRGAVSENAVLVISIPYLLIGFVFDYIKRPKNWMLKWRRILYGRRAIVVVLAVVVGFWILRNVVYS